MNNEEVVNKLKEVQAMHLPRMTYAKVKEYYGELPGFEETDENIKILDEYFNLFLDPKNEFIGNGCWLCGNKQVYLRWGIVHGVAHSECCGLSYKAYHYPANVSKDKKLFNYRVAISLQYHPDDLYINE